MVFRFDVVVVVGGGGGGALGAEGCEGGVEVREVVVVVVGATVVVLEVETDVVKEL